MISRTKRYPNMGRREYMYIESTKRGKGNRRRESKRGKMEDSAAILCQISTLKEMLDQVNGEIESNIQITREIESEIVKCTEFESYLLSEESLLTKTLYLSQFEIHGLLSVARDSKNSVQLLREELSVLTKKRDGITKRANDKREQFVETCLEFQREIGEEGSGGLENLVSEKEFLENEIGDLDQKNNTVSNSIMAFVEDVLQDLHDSSSALQAEIQRGNDENEKLLKDIDDLKTMLLSSFNFPDF